MYKIFLLILLTVAFTKAQTVSPSVINSAGDSKPIGSTGLILSSNIGEPFVQTLNAPNVMLSEGFLQPEIIAEDNIKLSVNKNNVSCKGQKDGGISVQINNPGNKYQFQYFWSPQVNCQSPCKKLTDLPPVVYSLTVVYTNTLSNVSDTIQHPLIEILDENLPCNVKIFNSISPNGDGVNDTWFIGNIREFPENRVSIYSRWGEKLFDVRGYNNDDVRWPRNEDVNIPSTTYFYIIELGDGTIYKGWIEVID